jgi:light-regulated signal transduction histidine kinase (bacteriophytochrome)
MDRAEWLHADPSSCDREPIHIPGKIQPHGMLIAVTEPDRTIVSASTTVEHYLGIAITDLVGRTLSSILSETGHSLVRDSLANAGQSGLEALHLQVGPADRRSDWVGLIHHHDGLALLELEPPTPPVPGGSALLLVSAAARRLHAAATMTDACQIAAEEVRRMTALDRIKVYRFAPDWSGEVLGEARDPVMPSYFGLHFPPSDIPAQARELYRLNPVRLIASIGYEPSPLKPDLNPATGRPIDLRFSVLRSVSPTHLEYLRNMQVGASMSVSILRNGELWGLIACHHRTERHIGFEARQACVLIAQLLASKLDTLESVERAGRSAKLATVRAHLLDAAATGHSSADAVQSQGEAILDLVEASGFAMVLPDRIVRIGRLPEDAVLTDVTSWLGSTDAQDEVIETDRLPASCEAVRHHSATISGLLAVPLSRSKRSYLLWCKPEHVQTVTWAGEPLKLADQQSSEPSLRPRKSFEAWVEQVRGRSAPWGGQDVAAAVRLRDVVLDLIVREKDELQLENLRLVHSTRELETFIYVASHDIKEPLRQMEVLASLLRTCVAPDAAKDAEELFGEFSTLATRLRKLTESLADYAKFGRSAENFGSVDLGEVIEEVLAQLRHVVEQTSAEISVGDLPIVLGERRQLHQLFINLIGNALKYRAQDRQPHIILSAETPLPHSSAPDRIAGMSRITVRDNGIGFDPKYDENIFETFWRLHPRDRYEGSGLGLAICRRIVERHGGRIDAHGEPDRGATIRLTLSLVSKM